MNNMRIPSFAEISIVIVKRTFHLRFAIAQLTRKSKIMKIIIDSLFFKDDEIRVIPNNKKININQKIESEGAEFLPTDVIKEVIRKCDDIVIMNSCVCRTSNKCEDYPHDIGCIFLGPTSRKIPRALCHEATAEEAIEQIDLADKAGLSHLIGRNKIDSFWMNAKPSKGLMTICHCCPCCCLWKVYPNVEDSIQERINRLEGVEVKVDIDKCNGCEKCIKQECYSHALSIKEGKVHIDQKHCLGCGLCANICNKGAISISYNDKSIESVIERCYNLIEE